MRLANIEFSDPKLVPWKEQIESAVANHANQVDAEQAFFMLCLHIQSIAAFSTDSRQGTKISKLIQIMTLTSSPASLINALLFLETSNIQPLSMELRIETRVTIIKIVNSKKYPPISFAEAVVYLCQRGLLNDGYIHSEYNFSQLIDVADLWFSEPSSANQFYNLPEHLFTQDVFDQLILINQQKMSLPKKRFKVCMTLLDIQSQHAERKNSFKETPGQTTPVSSCGARVTEAKKEIKTISHSHSGPFFPSKKIPVYNFFYRDPRHSFVGSQDDSSDDGLCEAGIHANEEWNYANAVCSAMPNRVHSTIQQGPAQPLRLRSRTEEEKALVSDSTRRYSV